jgi:hypothetical protein
VASSGFSIATSRHSSACARHRLLLSIILGSCAHQLAMASTISVPSAVRSIVDLKARATPLPPSIERHCESDAAKCQGGCHFFD